MAITVTATAGGTVSNGILLRVYVLTGTAPLQNGATAVQSAAAAHQATITTTVTGSRVYGACLNGAAASPTVVNASTTLLDAVADAGHTKDYATCKATSATGTPGATLLGFTDSNNGGIALLEVLPSGTVTEDASGPAAASTLAASTVTTAAFTPPPGSLLVALVSSNGASSVVITMAVSGGGLTWTAKAEASASNMKYAGVFTAQVPAATPAPQAQVWRPRIPPRARLGSRGLCAAGILATGIATQAPGAAVPPPQPRPVIQHAPPHRALWRSVTGAAYTAVPAPRQRPPQPRSPAPHAAIWRRNTAAPQQPQGPSRLPVPLRRPGPHRAIAGGARGPQLSAPAPGVAVPPPGWHPQPRYAPAHRVTWRAVTGLPAPAQTVTTPPPRQPPQVPRRPPPRALWRVLRGGPAATPPAAAPVQRQPPQIPRRIPARALWRGRAVSAQLSSLPVPHPAAIPRQAPHRVIWRTVTGSAPVQVAGVAVRAPRLIPQPRHLPPARATWRRLAGTANAPAAVTRNATSSPTVTDPRDGTAAVTARRTAAASVTDPRDGTRAVTATRASTGGVTGRGTSSPAVSDG